MKNNQSLVLDLVFKAMDFKEEDIKKITDLDREKMSEALIYMNMLYNNPKFKELQKDVRLTFYSYVKEYFMINCLKLEDKITNNKEQ